jgi:cobalamin biosynthesis Mg chelatase CobN
MCVNTVILVVMLMLGVLSDASASDAVGDAMGGDEGEWDGGEATRNGDGAPAAVATDTVATRNGDGAPAAVAAATAAVATDAAATRNGDGAPAAVAAATAAVAAATAAVATDAAATRNGDGAPVAAVDAAVVAVTAVAAVPRVVCGRKGPSGRSPMCCVLCVCVVKALVLTLVFYLICLCYI